MRKLSVPVLLSQTVCYSILHISFAPLPQEFELKVWHGAQPRGWQEHWKITQIYIYLSLLPLLVRRSSFFCFLYIIYITDIIYSSVFSHLLLPHAWVRAFFHLLHCSSSVFCPIRRFCLFLYPSWWWVMKDYNEVVFLNTSQSSLSDQLVSTGRFLPASKPQVMRLSSRIMNIFLFLQD